jgi:hypothetical protein
MLWRPLRIAAILSLMLLAAPIAFAQDADGPCAGDETLLGEWDVEETGGQLLIADGSRTRARVECRADGRLRHLIEISSDGGRTWKTLFDAVYSPMDAPVAEAATVADPAPSATVATAPSPSEPEVAAGRGESAETPTAADQQISDEPTQHQAVRQATEEGSEVNAVSRVLEREEMEEEEKPELRMASPMVLEIVPGEVDAYPEDTAWSTDETDGFMVNEVVLKKVSVGRKVKGGSVRLLIGATLFTEKRQRSVDLLFEAFLDGELVGTAQVERVQVGLNIPGHGKKGLVAETAMELSGEAFDSLFADDVERVLRVTLTSPSVR